MMPESPDGTARLIERIARWLCEHRPDYYARLQPGASDPEMDAFEAEFAVVLPEAFRALYRWRDGQPPTESGSFQNNWMFASLSDVSQTKRMLDGMIGYDFEDPQWWRRGWVPFLSNGGGDHLCLDLEPEAQEGRVFVFRHDEGQRPVQFEDTVAWLRSLAEAMESGAYRVV